MVVGWVLRWCLGSALGVLAMTEVVRVGVAGLGGGRGETAMSDLDSLAWLCGVCLCPLICCPWCAGGVLV